MRAKKLKVKLKIIVSFYQVATCLEAVYSIGLPPKTRAVLRVFDVVNLDVFGALNLPWACIRLGGYAARLRLMCAAPLSLTALIFGIGALSSTQVRWQHQPNGDGAARSNRRRLTVVAKEGVSWLRSLPFALRLTFLCFPAVSSLAFQGFDCDVMQDGHAYLRVDLSLECAQVRGVWVVADQGVRAAVGVTILCYTCLVPLLYMGLMWRARRALLLLQPTALSRALSFLTDDYEPVRPPPA